MLTATVAQGSSDKAPKKASRRTEKIPLPQAPCAPTQYIQLDVNIAQLLNQGPAERAESHLVCNPEPSTPSMSYANPDVDGGRQSPPRGALLSLDSPLEGSLSPCPPSDCSDPDVAVMPENTPANDPSRREWPLQPSPAESSAAEGPPEAPSAGGVSSVVEDLESEEGSGDDPQTARAKEKRKAQKRQARVNKRRRALDQPIPFGGRLKFPSDARFQATRAIQVSVDAETLPMATGGYVGKRTPRSNRAWSLADVRKAGYQVISWDGKCASMLFSCLSLLISSPY